jgi:hypothetical protein
MAHAVDDSAQKIPVIAYKRNREGWLVTMWSDDWFKSTSQGPDLHDVLGTSSLMEAVFIKIF